MTTAADFFCRLLVGRNVLTKRREIEVEVRYSYCGHSQGALISALNKAFEPPTITSNRSPSFTIWMT